MRLYACSVCANSEWGEERKILFHGGESIDGTVENAAVQS